MADEQDVHGSVVDSTEPTASSEAPAESAHRQDTIAVVIPAFNAAAWISEALDSVAAQSRPADELIVVDDGSTDDTGAEVGEWTKSAPLPVRLLSQPNAGLSAARNRGIGVAESEYIALLDADDLLLPHHLATLERAFARRSSLVLSFGNAERRTMEGHRSDPYLAGKTIERLAFEEVEPGIRVLTECAYSSLLYGSYIACCGTLFRRAAALAIGLFDEELRSAEDRDFWLRLSRVGGFAYTSEIVAVVRYHDANLTHPRHAVRNARNRLRVVQKMSSLRESLGLSPEERALTRAALAAHEDDYLHEASSASLASYLRALGELCAAGSLSGFRRPRHLVRALRAGLRQRSR